MQLQTKLSIYGLQYLLFIHVKMHGRVLDVCTVYIWCVPLTQPVQYLSE